MKHWTQNGFCTNSPEGHALDDIYGHRLSNYEAVCFDDETNTITHYTFNDENHTELQEVTDEYQCTNIFELAETFD